MRFRLKCIALLLVTVMLEWWPLNPIFKHYYILHRHIHPHVLHYTLAFWAACVPWVVNLVVGFYAFVFAIQGKPKEWPSKTLEEYIAESEHADEGGQ